MKTKPIDSGGYETGYGKPPEHSRFKKGESGNPKGRPKGSKGFAALLDRALKARVIINEAGRRKTISKLEAALKQIANKAASGDAPTLRLLMPLLLSLDQQPNQSHSHPADFDESDQKVIARMFERYGLVEKKGPRE